VKSTIIMALACLVLFSAALAPVSAGTLGELFTAASASNQEYAVYKLDLELAALKKTKGEIEARVELERVNAKNTYVTALSAYRSSVLGFYTKVLDAVFSAATAELDLESGSLSLENAKEDRTYADSRYKNGLITEEAFKEIDIALKTASSNQELAAWTLKDAKDTVRRVTGLEWKTALVPEMPAFEAAATVEDWVAKDTALELANLAVKIAELKTASLATNASTYDKRIQETENAKVKVAASSAASAATRAYESALSTLKNQAALLQIRSDEYALKELAFQDAQRQYEKGTLSLSGRNLSSVALLAARKNLLLARKSYLASMGSYLSAMGENPPGL
jgi:outer membrane protein TolC